MIVLFLAAVVLQAPDFRVTPVEEVSGTVTLRLVSVTRNRITDRAEWFQRNNLQLNVWRDAIPETFPTVLQGLTLRRAISSAGRILGLYGENHSSKLMLAAQHPGASEPEYILDFSQYQFAPRNRPEDFEFVAQQVTWAEQAGDVLYVAHGHSTYARSSYGMTGYITAIDLRTQRVLWHSRPLVSNAGNFALLGDDYLITGYGFTAEPDHLYVLRRSDGEAAAKIPLKSAPDAIVIAGERVYVRTYDRDYVFRVSGRVSDGAPRPSAAPSSYAASAVSSGCEK